MRTVDKLRIAFGTILTSTGACAGTTAPRPSQTFFWPGPPSSSSAAPVSSEMVRAMVASSNAELYARQAREQAERATMDAAMAAEAEAEARRVKPTLGTLPVFKNQACTDAWNTASLQGVAPSTPIPDYLAWRVSDARGRAHTVAEVGWRCRGARDEATCSARLDAAAPTSARTISPTFFVLQRGDTDDVIDTWPRLLAMLGPIDTLQEASLIAKLRGYSIECGVSTIERRGNAWQLTALSGGVPCRRHGIVRGHVLRLTRDGSVTIESTIDYAETDACPVPGRRPYGWHCAPGVGESPLGAYFAQQAELEAASVVAFARIERELVALAAPPALVRRAARAAQDEVRHARMMRKLAERFGGHVRDLDIAEVGARNLFDFALDNAVEGTVHETYSALVARYQAAHSVDPDVARTMRMIAADECRHAALSWDLAQWVEAQLGVSELVQLHTQMALAYERLLVAGEPAVDTASLQVAGLPDAMDDSALRVGFVHESRAWRMAA